MYNIMGNALEKHNRWTGFPYLINELGLEIGLEVGVCEGYHSKNLLNKSNLKHLYGVDKAPLYIQMRREGVLDNDRFIFHTGQSPEYAENFCDNFFDFIHIDAWHTYKACLADMNGWWPKLKVGGVFCGDDWLTAHDHPESAFGVIEAVEEFCHKNKLDFYITGSPAITQEERLKVGQEAWAILKQDLASAHTTFDVPQWWLIKR